MKKKLIFLVLPFVLLSCGPRIVEVLKPPIENTLPPNTLKESNLSKDFLKDWPYMDLMTDTIPGMSIDKMYQELLEGRPSTTVVVGVIDSGVDIKHEDLKDVIWTNKNEVPNNGQDDDHNGYVDDVHGWNFLGDAVHEQLEMTRIISKGDDGSEMYKEAKKTFDDRVAELNKELRNVNLISSKVITADSILQIKLGKKEYTLNEVSNFLNNSENQILKAKCKPIVMIGMPIKNLKKALLEQINYLNNQFKYNLNLTFDGRKAVGDNPNDFEDVDYGNNNVSGPDIEETLHGTHVAGIIAANRNNNLGMKGVSNNVKIMVVRAVPDGDEYDKDVDLAIRYAVDNGAKVINTSFGKSFSPHADKVKAAIKYASTKDVLIVNAAGNESENIDEKTTFPTDVTNGAEISDNMITVGAITYDNNSHLVAEFSNYGSKNVDIFAPGVSIWSTSPNDSYKFLQGTSMASPEVAGVAALIRSYYPKLKANQVKHIIMNSGLVYNGKVLIGNEEDEKNFSSLSKSGKIINAYNAFILANKVARKKVKL